MLGLVYKILTEREWREARDTGVFRGSPDDLRDGFLHFSTASQVRETVRRHFQSEDRLVLLALNPAEMGAELRWEPSRGGENFPHLYGVLTCGPALRPEMLTKDEHGDFVFPPDIR